MKPIFYSTRGSSLVQLLVGIVIVGILISSILTMIVNSYKHEAHLAVLLEGRELAGELIELSKSDECGIVALPSGISISPSAFPNKDHIDLADGISGRFLKLKAGDTYGKHKIESVQISPYVDKSTGDIGYVAMDAGIGESDFLAATRVKASLTLNVSVNQMPKKPISVPVTLELDETNKQKIISCNSLTVGSGGPDLEVICEDMLGGVLDPSTLKCKLPCPDGMDTASDGSCSIEASGGNNLFCDVNQSCGVEAKFIMN